MIGTRDVILKEDRPKVLLLDKHEQYLRHYAKDDSGTEQIMAEYLKMSGMYWGLNALYLMDTLNDESPEVAKALEFIKSCQTEEGGFSASLNHDPHILHTVCAVQMLVILDKCHPEYIDKDRCANYIASLQQEDGSFFGDKWGEVDTRFSLCALACLKLIDRLSVINMKKAVDFVISCYNQIDGGFGRLPGSESHTAYVYCCVSTLAIANQLERIDVNQLGWWLSERQLPSGGLNGRPEKLPDLCYSWWCLSSMKMIGKMHLIDLRKLVLFILACQDEEQGGFSDRPGNLVDPYHTMFGIAGLSLIYHHYDSESTTEKPDNSIDSVDNEFQAHLKSFKGKLKRVNPILCIPEERLPI